MMKKDGSLVGYETIMALSQHLRAVILVTSGGTTDNDAVRTDSFYFGEERPEKQIHIVWSSDGFYNPVVSVSNNDVRGSAVGVGQRDSRSCTHVIHEISEQDSWVDVDDGIMKLHASHVCECQTLCECRRWAEEYIFPHNTPTPTRPVTSRLTQPESWHEVFAYLCGEATVLQLWKSIMRDLKLAGATLMEIDKANKSLHETVYEAFESWRNENVAADVTLARLQEALLKSKLIRVAGMFNTVLVH